MIGDLAPRVHEAGATRCQEAECKWFAGKGEELLRVLASDPYQTPPPFEKLVGDLAGAYSRRINIQHRLVYQILDEERVVKVLRMWTHYE